MRRLPTMLSLGPLSMAILIGCGLSSDVAPPGDLSESEKKAAEQEVQAVEDSEMAQQQRMQDRQR